MTFWADEEAALLDPDRDHVIRDSKTPSGAVPISGLRGPIITDALYRTFKQRGRRVRYVFTIDDYDPVDSQSMRQDPFMGQYMGMPLFAVPSPDPAYSDFARYHADRYLGTFAMLGIKPEEVRWLRDLYRSGALDKQIDLVLRNSAVIRRVYAEVANVVKDEGWLPVAVICESCGRIGTTYATDYRDGTVAYSCKPDYVTWAHGCGHQGRVSPFGGRAKLYWNLQWCAMWDHFGVTYEEGGKDLLTAGGSRDRADHIYREVWHKEPPVGLMHEFLNIGGRKMSTSRPEEWQQFGVAAHDLSAIYPAYLIRFLMLRTDPKRHIDFEPTGDSLPRLVDEYDRCADEYTRSPDGDLARVWLLSQVDESPRTPGYRVKFSLVAEWVQTPGVDVLDWARMRKGMPLTEDEEIDVLRRQELAQFWLERWAPEERRFLSRQLQPDFVLSDGQRVLLVEVKTQVGQIHDSRQMEEYLRSVAKHVGLTDERGRVAYPAYQAVYWALLGKPKGPRAARLLTSYSRDFVTRKIDEALARS